MAVTVRQLADLVHGHVVGDGDLVIHSARTLSEAQPGDITFVENGKHLATLDKCEASAVLVPVGIPVNGKVQIQVADPLFAFVDVVRHLHLRPESRSVGVDPRASVHSSVRLGENVSIEPFVSIGEGTVVGDRCRFHSGVSIGPDCRIGDDVVLRPNVVLYEGVTLGHRVVIHANSVIGSDGFGYRLSNGKHQKVPQLGTVEIGDDVEIGSCTTIDRGAFSATRIGKGTKIDNLVQIAHNCQIGPHNILVAQVGIAGSSSTGSYVVMAGQSGMVDHIHLGDGAVVGAKTAVTRSVAAGERVLGIPAIPAYEQMKVWVTLEKLPEMRRDIRRIKKQLEME